MLSIALAQISLKIFQDAGLPGNQDGPRENGTGWETNLKAGTSKEVGGSSSSVRVEIRSEADAAGE